MLLQQKQSESTDPRKLLFVITVPYLAMTVLLVVIACGSMGVLSGIRAYVEGESLWSKAQKEAVLQLQLYADSGDQNDFERYQQYITVPLGDRVARLTLRSEHPDLVLAAAGFLQGANHPDDVAWLIRLFRASRHVPFMAHLVDLWASGDVQLDRIIDAGNQLHAVYALPAGLRPPMGGSLAMQAALAQLHAADAAVTPIEAQFSAALGDASRKTNDVLQICIVTLAAILLTLAFIFTRSWMGHYSRIERTLRLKEERLDLAVRGSDHGIWNWSIHAEETYLSPSAFKLLGLREGHPASYPDGILACVHRDDLAGVIGAIQRMMTTDALLDFECRVFTQDYTDRWILVRGRVLQMANGRAVRAAGSITDITDRKLTEHMRSQLAVEAQFRSEQAQVVMLEQIQGRIGRELHDDLGQLLTGVAFLAKSLEQRLGMVQPSEQSQMEWIVKLINEAIDRVRFLSRQLSPIAIDQATLSDALRRLMEDIQEIFGTRIELRMAGDEALIPTQHVNQFFRIAQESISNALRHGHATRIAIAIDTRVDGTRLAICDDGHGFAPKEVACNAGLGLRSMAIRAKSLHGRLRIRSRSTGTIVIVRSTTYYMPVALNEPE